MKNIVLFWFVNYACHNFKETNMAFLKSEIWFLNVVGFEFYNFLHNNYFLVLKVITNTKFECMIYLSPPWKYECIGLGNVGTDLVDLRPSMI